MANYRFALVNQHLPKYRFVSGEEQNFNCRIIGFSAKNTSGVA